jgi:lactate dehydrogenase-like 2-hydroxyacid dehydrogenase
MQQRVLVTRANLPGGDPARLASVDAALLDAAGPSLRVVALAGMGYDAVDQEAAAERGVVVTHTPGVLAETTADLTFALVPSAAASPGTPSRV